jgi:hypothetical protein
MRRPPIPDADKRAEALALIAWLSEATTVPADVFLRLEECVDHLAAAQPIPTVRSTLWQRQRPEP